MHRLPKFFSHSSEQRKGPMGSSSSYGGGSSRGASKPKRLDRRNAVKNINYDFSPSTSASSSSYLSDESLRRRSADLYGDKSSFRVDGTNGEFDIICKTFGFSGIDDFQISPEEYESMKVRSSSAPVEFSRALGPILYQEPKISDNIRDVVSEKVEDSRDIGHIDRNRVNVTSKEFEDAVRVSESGRSSELRGNGIKGVRPPALEPPTLMMDKDCSTWNTSREFVLDSDTCVSNLGRGFCVDDEDGRDRSKQGDMRRMIRADNRGLLEPFYFSTTSNDDDSSSTTTEPATSISPNAKFRRGIKDWQKGERLGGGSFGSVYEGIADDGFFFAVKEVSLLDQGDEGKQCIIQLEQEIALLSQFQHENIVQYYGTKKDESHLYIFLELVTKGSLSSLYQKYDMRVLQASAYTRQILRGLKYLHDRNVVHRDIKCANILVHTNGSVKLADFGLAKATKLNDLKSCKGTAFWMAPEVVRNQWYGLAADIWSLGCTVLEMLTKRFPYANLERGAAIYKIGKGEKPPIPDSLSSDARDFILQCLQVDPSSRPTAAQLLDHPFVKESLPSSGRASSPQNFGGPI